MLLKRRNYLKRLLLAILILAQNSLKSNENTNKSFKDLFVHDEPSRTTKILIDSIFLKHHISPNHPETPKRIEYIKKLLKKFELEKIISKINLDIDAEFWINKLHTKHHIDSIKKNAPLAHKVSEAAVKAALTSIDMLMNNICDNVFCATRPPGHHAINDGREEGFCYYNNIAIAAKYAQQKYGLKKVLIVDWDYHHGNSTEYMFYDDPSVLFFSTHDQFAYPGTGDPNKKGIGLGEGFNINIHLPCGANDEMILNKYKEILLPAAKKFKPDIVLVSAGFDSKKNDPLGCFDITDDGFINLTKVLMEIADEHCEGRIISILEGGYNVESNAYATVFHILTLQGKF